MGIFSPLPNDSHFRSHNRRNVSFIGMTHDETMREEYLGHRSGELEGWHSRTTSHSKRLFGRKATQWVCSRARWGAGHAMHAACVKDTA